MDDEELEDSDSAASSSNSSQSNGSKRARLDNDADSEVCSLLEFYFKDCLES
jgi:hypothetical protein